MKAFILFEIVFFVVLFIIILLILKIYSANKFVKRISLYSINPLKDDKMSFYDRVINKYLDFVKKFRPIIKKSSYFRMRSKKYESLIKYQDRDRIEAIDFITNKFVIAGLFLLLAIISQIITFRPFGIFRCFLNLIIGYYLLDIYYFFYHKKQTKLVGNELLRAVIIMNNAFKAGKSTLQALKIASEELPYPINDEFKKMYLDMKFGLSVDTTFDRFAKRVGIEEAIYLSSSLSILNRTGGNIVEVFSSIERTLFDKKKLNEELKNISSAPKVVVYILFAVPIVFSLIIFALNHDYFKPLVSSPLGFAIIGIIIVMFGIYVFLLRRILRIEVE